MIAIVDLEAEYRLTRTALILPQSIIWLAAHPVGKPWLQSWFNEP
jgi:hypothetical protein